MGDPIIIKSDSIDESPMPELFSRYFRGIELTQSIQYYRSSEHLSKEQSRPDNSIPMIAHKPIVVRAYLRNEWWISVGPGEYHYPPGCPKPPPWGDGTPPDCAVYREPVIFTFKGQLEVSRRNQRNEFIPFYSTECSRIATREAGYRDQRAEDTNTLSFVIPAGEVHGALQLRITVYHPVTKEPLATAWVDCNASLKQTLKLHGIMISYREAAAAKTLAPPGLFQLHQATQLALQMFPVESSAECSLAVGLSWTGPLASLEDWDLLKTQVQATAQIDIALRKEALAIENKKHGTSRQIEDVIYYALLPAQTPRSNIPGSTSVILGAATVGGIAGVGYIDRFATAHELGHLLGFEHAPCGIPPGGIVEPWPDYNPTYTPATIGEYGTEWTSELQVYEPKYSSDFMSYCVPKIWIAPHHYLGLINHPRLHPKSDGYHLFPLPPIPNKPLVPQFDRPDPPDFILVTGLIHRFGEVRVEGVTRLPTHPGFAGGRKTKLVADLIGAKDVRISSAPVYSSITATSRCECSQDDSESEWQLFSACIPAKQRGSALRIHLDGKALWERSAPLKKTRISQWQAHVATGRNKSGIEIKWDAETATPETTKAWIQWSADRGSTWHLLFAGLREKSAFLSFGRMPGGPVLLKLLLDDGFETVPAKPISLQIPAREPAVTVFMPQEGQRIPAQSPVRLWAAAEGEDGVTIGPDGIQWFVDGKREGTGLDVFCHGLTPGLHRATLVVSTKNHKVTRAIEMRVTDSPATNPIE